MSAWRDMVVVSLVREGIDKHRARELADHFAAQPEPPPEWEWINNILHEYGLQAIDFVADWRAAQRPWQGLTPEELQFYRKKHSKLFNAGYDKVTETNLIAEEFDSIAFYKEVSTVLKERNT